MNLFKELPINVNPRTGKATYNMENMRSIDVYKGYVSVDKSIKFSNLIEKIDMRFNKHKDDCNYWFFSKANLIDWMIEHELFGSIETYKYTDKRYGNIEENKESVSGYMLIDFDAAYTQKKLLSTKEGIFGMTITNLTNQKYISFIIMPDKAVVNSSNTISYQRAPPFSGYLEYMQI